MVFAGGKTAMRMGKNLAARLVCAGVFLVFCGAAVATNEPQVPVVDGNIGSCTADFTVKDGAGKPIYNAKIDVLIKYGFFSMRKTELEAGTNSDGKARFTGLPNRLRKPMEFTIKSGTVTKTVTDDPSDTCNAVYNVTLSAH
jgi:hypothetical protein